jgi:two-component system nitrogen regulation sensor histidine kinase NtrY
MVDQDLYGERESKKRRNEFYIIMIISLLIVTFTYFEMRLPQIGRDIPIAYNIIVFTFININIILLLLLIFLVIRNLVKLIFERKQRILGAKLRTKLVAAFVSLSLVPTLLLFFVAVGFITSSMEKWFSVQVEQSLQGSLEVAQTYYRDFANNAIYYGKQISRSISQKDLVDGKKTEGLKKFMERQRIEYNLGIIEIFSKDLKQVAMVTDADIPDNPLPEPNKELLAESLKGKEVSKTRVLGSGELITGVVPIYASPSGKGKVIGAVVTNFYVPKSLAAKMVGISKAFRDYKHLKILRKPIKSSYLVALLMVTLLIIFSATWFGFYLAKGITIPIQQLAEGTEKVASGDLDFYIDISAKDEIGKLVNSFNKMTHDLKASKDQLEKTNIDLERRKEYIEIILKSIAAGVISIDKEGNISTINKSAERMLGIEGDRVLGRRYREVLDPEYREAARQWVREINSTRKDTIEKQVAVTSKGQALTLLVHITVLRSETGSFMGIVAIFDDLTQLVKAQRVAAWREVARRIAHEIKNPLTPIQLSAQRLRKRYGNKLTEDGAVFDECTETIMKQTGELKELVNEFSNFARMPTAKPAPNNLREIINEVLLLFKQAHKDITFEHTCEDGIPIMNLDRDQIKRVMINLFQNAVSAIETAGNGGEVVVRTGYNDEFQMVTTEVTDTGCGIPEEDKSRLFEPYFSTKKSGTGLGLAIVNTIISDHHGYIRVKDNLPNGTKFIIELPVGA